VNQLKAKGSGMNTTISDMTSSQDALTDIINSRNLSKLLTVSVCFNGTYAAANGTEHREINMLMLATSLAPEGFMSI